MSEKQMDYVNIDKIQPNDIIANSQLTINRNFAELAEKLNNIIHLLGTNGVFDNYYPIDIEWNKSDNGMIYGNMILNDELETELPTQPLLFATQEMGGILSTTSQAIAGNKTFINDIILSYDKLNKKWSSLKGIDSRPIITQYPNSVVIGDPSDPKKSISINYKDGKVVSITSGVFDTEQIKNDFTDYLNSELAKLQEKIISGITDANKKLCDYFKIPFDQQNDKKIENWWGNTHINDANKLYYISGSTTINEDHFTPWYSQNVNDMNNHIGDTYVDIVDRKCYIYLYKKEISNYIWENLDKEEELKGIIQILLDAANALSVTDGMSRTFVSPNCPEPPYDEGDMWIKTPTDNQNNTELLYCINPKKAGEKGDEKKDWGSFTAYIKEDALDAWKNDLEEQLKNQLDKKISNWFGVGSPEGEDGNQKRPWLDDSDSDFDEDKFHENDIYTDIGKLPQGESDDDPDVSATAGYTWAFIKQEDNKTYKWIKTGQMSAFEQLLQSIGGIDGIKDGIRDYYYVTYGYWQDNNHTHKVGDIWVVKIDNKNPDNNDDNYHENEIYMCMKSDEKNPHSGWNELHWMRILGSTDYNDLVEKILNTQASLDSINTKFTSLNDDNVFSLLEKITIRNEWFKISGESKDSNRPTSDKDLLKYYINLTGANGSFQNTYKIIKESKLESSIDQSILSGYEQSFLILSKYLISCKLFENSETLISDIYQPFKDTLLSYFTDYYAKEQNILIILQTLKITKEQNDGQIRQFAGNCPVWKYKFPDFENWNYSDHLGDVYRDVSSGKPTSGWLWRFTEGGLEGNCKKEDYPNPTGTLPIPNNLVIEDSDSDSDSDNNKTYHWHHETLDELNELAKKLEELSNKYQNSDDDDFTLFVKKPDPYIYQAGDIWIVHKDDYTDEEGVECLLKDGRHGYAKQGDFLVAINSVTVDYELHDPDDWELTDVSESIKQSTLEKSGLDVLTKIANEGITNIEGGLVLTNLILMKDVDSAKVQGGISGKKDDRVGLFFGDSYENAWTYANQIQFEKYKKNYKLEIIKDKKKEIVTTVSELLNTLLKALNTGDNDTNNSLKSLLNTCSDWTTEDAKNGIIHYFNDEDDVIATAIQTYVNTQPKHPPVLITKDGEGSNIGGCYIDDLSKLRVPSDHIDNLIVNTLTAIEDGSTCVTKVDNSSFMIEDGKAYIKMSLYNGQPLITGCDKDGTVVFEIGGHVTNGTANYQYNDTVFNILVNSNNLDEMSLTDVEKSRAVTNLPKVSIVPNWNNGVNEFKLTDIHFEYKIGTKNQYIQYEWDGLKDVKNKPIYQYGSETLLSRIDSIYPTNCDTSKVTIKTPSKQQVINDDTPSWNTSMSKSLTYYSQIKELSDLLHLGRDLFITKTQSLGPKDNKKNVFVRGPLPNSKRQLDPFNTSTNVSFNELNYYYSCLHETLYKIVDQDTDDYKNNKDLTLLSNYYSQLRESISKKTGISSVNIQINNETLDSTSPINLIYTSNNRIQYKIDNEYQSIIEYLSNDSDLIVDRFIYMDLVILNTKSLFSTADDFLALNLTDQSYVGYYKQDPGTLEIFYISGQSRAQITLWGPNSDLFQGSSGFSVNQYDVGISDNFKKFIVSSIKNDKLKFTDSQCFIHYDGFQTNSSYRIPASLTYTYDSTTNSDDRCSGYLTYKNTKYMIDSTTNMKNIYNNDIDNVTYDYNNKTYTWLKETDSTIINNIRKDLLLDSNPYWLSIKSYLKGSSVQLPKLYDVKFRAKYQYNEANYGALYYNWSDSVICRFNNSVISNNTTVDNTKYVVSDFICKYGDNNIISYKEHTNIQPQIQCSIMKISDGTDITDTTNITYEYELDSKIGDFSLLNTTTGNLKVKQNTGRSPRQCKINIKIKYKDTDKNKDIIVGSETIIVTQECVVTRTYLYENSSIAQNFDHNFSILEKVYDDVIVDFDKIGHGNLVTP